MVFCRNSTLLCRQEVRRSMVFSAVQISMPGTSCARVGAGVSTPDIASASTSVIAATIRPILKTFILVIFATVNLLRACDYRQASAGRARYHSRDTIVKPHSRAEFGQPTGCG